MLETLTKEQQKQLVELISNALYEEAAHHKQWYIEEIAKVLGIDVELECDDFERGIAP